MGFNLSGAWLASLACKGRSVGRICTYGVQDWNVSPEQDSVLEVMGLTVAHSSNEFLSNITSGAQITSIDASSYQDCTNIHNLSLPLHQFSPLLGTSDLVIDLGTSEHVFCPGNSLFNGVRILKKGGLLVSSVPCNGSPLHGMYQIGPNSFAALDTHGFMHTKLLAVFKPFLKREEIENESCLLFLFMNQTHGMDSDNMICEWFDRNRESSCFYVGQKKNNSVSPDSIGTIYQTSFFDTSSNIGKHWLDQFHGKSLAKANLIRPEQNNEMTYACIELPLRNVIYGDAIMLFKKLQVLLLKAQLAPAAVRFSLQRLVDTSLIKGYSASWQ